MTDSLKKRRGGDPQLRQNILLSLVVTSLGVYINVFHTVVDRMAGLMGRTAVESGIFISFYALGSLVSLLLSSSLSDRVGKRRVISAGLLMMSLGFALLSLATSENLLLAGLFCFGFGFAPTEAIGSALLGDENPDRASMWMNISQSGFGLGAILGPLLAMAYVGRISSYRGLYLWLCLTALALFLLIILTGRGRMRPVKKNAPQSLNMFSVLRDRPMRYLALIIFFYLGYESVAPAYLKQFVLNAGVSEPLSAMMISLFWAAMIVGRLIGTLLTGREYQSIRVFTAFVALGAVLLITARSAALLFLCVGLIGFGCGPVWPMLVALAARRFPERSGAAIGMMMLSSMASFTLFPPLIGTLPNNLSLTFFFSAVLAALVILTTTIAMKKEVLPR